MTRILKLMVTVFFVDAGKTEPAAKPADDENNRLFAKASKQYESSDRFVVTMPSEGGDPIRFVLHRDPQTTSWRVAEIRLPLRAAG